ncbi:hypothetical protein ACB098_05G188900 [Castanea mollissima]
MQSGRCNRAYCGFRKLDKTRFREALLDCGGLFCNSCTQQRIFLRGQGDSPVRICEPCKKIEEAARFEMRHGHKGRVGCSKLTSRDEDEVLNQILGSAREESFSSARESNSDSVSASCSNAQEVSTRDREGEINRSISLDEPNHLKSEIGKELDRQAEALDIYLRKSRKKVLSSRNMADSQNKDGPNESGKEKDDLAAELRELGWSDKDLFDEGKKSKTNKDKGSGGIDKTEVVAPKKKAIMLKREGKLTEAKEELKRAKVLGKQFEEQELLAGAEEDSNDELSALIRCMDNDKEENSVQYEKGHGLNFDHLVGASGDLIVDGNLEVMDEDMEDPEIAAALQSFGWTEGSIYPENISHQSVPVDREAMLSEIHSLKREAEKGRKDVDPKLEPKSRLTIQKELLSLKKKALALRREGRLHEAEEELKKGRALELQLEQMDNSFEVKATGVTVGRKDLDFSYKHTYINRNLPLGEGEGEDDVTDQDMLDPTYLSVLKNLGWTDEDIELEKSAFKSSSQDDNQSVQIIEPSSTQTPSNTLVRASRSKAELQRELLNLKRKALALRRQGKAEEAEEVLSKTKALEAQIAEIEAPKREVQIESNRSKDENFETLEGSSLEEVAEVHITENNMHDPATLSKYVNKFLSVLILQIHLNPKETLGIKRKALALRRKGETEQANVTLRMVKVLEAQIELLEAPKKEPLINVIEDKRPEPFELLSTNKQVVESSMGLGRLESDTVNPPLRNADVSISLISQFTEGNSSSSVKLGTPAEMSPPENTKTEGANYVPPPGHSLNLMDLLTGDDWSYSRKPDENSTTHLGSLTSDKGDLGQKDSVTTQKREMNDSSLHQEILAHKRKAVALKREEKLTEAREEFRKANDVSTSNIHSVGKKDHGTSNLAPKPLSSRDCFKLQQESLGHKCRALKLRREGFTEEAEAEFELAKALETYVGKSETSTLERTQLEEWIKAEKVKAVKLKRSGKQAEALDALRRAKLFEKKLSALQ